MKGWKTYWSFTLLLCSSLLCGTDAVSSLEQTQAPPNIVIILTDDLGYGDVSFLNKHSKIQTPSIDRLAAEGVWLTDAHSPSSVCSPTRYGLLTGRYPWRVRRLRQFWLWPWEKPVIAKDRLTIAKMLKQKGYDTACIGKWHLGMNWPWKEGNKPSNVTTSEMFDWSRPITGGPWEAGFDYYFGDDVTNFPPFAFIEDGKLLGNIVNLKSMDLKSIGFRGGIHGDGPGQEGWSFEKVMPTLTEKATEYIEKKSQSNRPFFLFFSTTSPHTPVAPTKEFQGKSQAGYYGDYVAQTDDSVGQIIDALKKSGILENTLIIFTSDNGPAPTVRSIMKDHDHFPAGIFRGMKGDSWEGGHRVPFIVSWPNGKLEGGREIDSLVSLTDIFATIAKIVEFPVPKGEAEDSLDILPLLLGGKSIRDEMLLHNPMGKLGLRSGTWVYLRGGGAGGGPTPDWYKSLMELKTVNAPHGLFDLSNDPGQRHNVYDQYQERARIMDARLKELETELVFSRTK